MDLVTYYRNQATSARRLAGVYQEHRQAKAALERATLEYDGTVQDLEKRSGRDPACLYDLAAYINAWRTGWSVAGYDAPPVDQPIKVARQTTRADADQGRANDIEPHRQTSRQVEDEVTPEAQDDGKPTRAREAG
jgi:hypothetical protein